MRAVPSKPLRCAIYTRVSTEHGLEQEFNSLDAQREAAEAYIKSQAHEGWRLVPIHYDDGGFSGGSMERPALRQLLFDIRAGSVDIVVVYKVDRLTRSLADFAKLVELFDEQGVSFVSVTQAFNTTTSMGRLTLNVLLSFAQFEREVTGERIRDKIAASKRKGLWMGGVVPLGYRVESRKLVIDESEAEQVRMIFRRYLEIGSVPRLQEELRQAGVVTRPRALSSGRVIGGIPFTNGPLGHLLRNRVYLGEIKHKGKSFPGEHKAIISRQLFEAVQTRLAQNGTEGRRWWGSQALLIGRIYDDRGNRMTPAHANKGGARYRYYVSQAVLQRRRENAGTISRVPAPELEQAVIQAIRAQLPPGGNDALDQDIITSMVERVIVREGVLEIMLQATDGVEPSSLTISWSRPPHTRKRELVLPKAVAEGISRPIRPEARTKLLLSIARGRVWVEELVSGQVTSTHAIAAREGLSERSVRMTLFLAFLTPDLVKAAVEGRLTRGTGVTSFTDLPSDWAEQRRLLGSDAAARQVQS
jgi:DNA invertase Pin-like site-specific DNA recombinase